MAPLTGTQLLAAVQELTKQNKSKSSQAKECGYIRTIATGNTAGKEMPDLVGFSNALLEAQGIVFGDGGRSYAPRGVLTVSKAGLVAVGKAYLGDAVPGDQYKVEIEEGGVICLVPVAEEEGIAVAA